jgi:hypothetical protein
VAVAVVAEAVDFFLENADQVVHAQLTLRMVVL